LVVEYTFEENDMGVTYGLIRFDFGMIKQIVVSPEYNSLCAGYNKLTPQSGPVEILKNTIQFDLFHAFYHYEHDPNYEDYHWALVGHLKDRVKSGYSC